MNELVYLKNDEAVCDSLQVAEKFHKRHDKLVSEIERVRKTKRKREKEILHNYMEVLAHNYENIEPDVMSSSICEIYDRLNRPFDTINNRFLFVVVNALICITVLVVNFFRRKS